MGFLGLPSFTILSNIVADTVQNTAFSHCNILCVSTIDPHVLIGVDGSVFSVYEVIGTNRYLTPETEYSFIQELDKTTESTLRSPHHTIGMMFVRDPSRTRTSLDDIFKSTLDTIKHLGIDAAHFFEQQKQDLQDNCSFERSLLIVKTARNAIQGDKPTELKLDHKKIVIDEVPLTAQNTLRDSIDLVQEHLSFATRVTTDLKKFIGLSEVDGDTYLKFLKEEEDLVSLSKTKWKPKTPFCQEDLTLNDNENDFVTHPPLAYQITTDDKNLESRYSSIINTGDHYIATLDREYFHIQKDSTFQEFFRALDRKIPIRMYYELSTGTERFANELKVRKTFLLFFMINKYGRDINHAIENIIHQSETLNKTLLKGTLSVATWSADLETVKKYKRDIKQAMLSWGAMTVRSPADAFGGYYSSLPAFSKKQTPRPCIQISDQHLATLPFSRAATPMKTGGVCLSTVDGKLFPINTKSSEQDYGVNLIIGGMNAGKTVLTSVLNNSFVFAAGNADLPPMSYIDFGSGVHNYFNSLRNWLPKSQQYKIECIAIKNEDGFGFNVLEPQFGLNTLEETERESVLSFLAKIVNGTSSETVSGQLGNSIARIISAFFAYYQKHPLSYEPRVAEYVKQEQKLHREVNELIDSEELVISDNEVKTWYLVRDRLFQLDESKYFSHARFCHRRGSPDLRDLKRFLAQSVELSESLSAITVQSGNGTTLVSYFVTALEGVLERYHHILGKKSQIDVSQAKMIGIDLKRIAGTKNDEESLFKKQLFGMLARYLGSRNFWRNPADFMEYVPKIYQEHYRRVLDSEANILKHELMDEYAQMKSKELDQLTENTAYIARKYNLAMTISTQQLHSAPQNYVSLATNVYILSASDSDAEIMQKKFKLSDSFVNEARRRLKSSDGFGRLILYIGRFTQFEGYLVQLLRNQVTPSYLWNFASDEDDETIKRLARLRFGERHAFLKLAKAFPKGTIKHAVESRMNMTAQDTIHLTKQEVILEMLDALERVNV